MHLCSDEIFAFMAALPGIGLLWAWMKARITRSRLRKPVKTLYT